MTEHLLPVLLCHDQIRPRWCFDLDTEKSSKAAEIFGLQPVDTIDSCFAPDLIISAVHPTSSKAVIQAGHILGCPVFLEKPGGLNIEHIIELEMLAQNLKVNTWFGYNYRHSDMAKIVHKIIAYDPAIAAEYEFLSRRPLVVENDEPTLFECWMRGNAVHLMDFIRYLHGKDLQLRSTAMSVQGDRFLLVVDFKDANNCLVRAKMGNITTKFAFRSRISTRSGVVVRAEGFDSVSVDHGLQTEIAYKASTFNKLRSKDGFYDQFSRMIESTASTSDQFRIARNAMTHVERLIFEKQPNLQAYKVA